MFFIKVYGQFPETSEKLAFLASQKNMSLNSLQEFCENLECVYISYSTKQITKLLLYVCLLTSKLPHQSWYKIGSLALSICQ